MRLNATGVRAFRWLGLRRALCVDRRLSNADGGCDMYSAEIGPLGFPFEGFAV